MLVNAKGILEAARDGGYGIASPNIYNGDTMRAAIEVAEELRAPMVLDIWPKANKNVYDLGTICRYYASQASVPIAVQQDHGEKFEDSIKAIRAGYTSIMVDRSSLPFEENCAQVKELVRIAQICGVSVEAEIGHVGEGSTYELDRNASLTDPEEAQRFVEITGVDSLAVAIGTAHGEYVGTPYLDFDLLKKLRETVSVPLVLHGGSGTGDENLARATSEGITKVNIASDLFSAGAKAWNEVGTVYSSAGSLLVQKGYKEKLAHFVRLFRQNNRA